VQDLFEVNMSNFTTRLYYAKNNIPRLIWSSLFMVLATLALRGFVLSLPLDSDGNVQVFMGADFISIILIAVIILSFCYWISAIITIVKNLCGRYN
jgi:hypothetical protein